MIFTVWIQVKSAIVIIIYFLCETVGKKNKKTDAQDIFNVKIKFIFLKLVVSFDGWEKNSLIVIKKHFISTNKSK